jgi:PIN domain nuclease of toxin-antitoxin system
MRRLWVGQMLQTQSVTISSITSEAGASLMFTNMATFERCPMTRISYVKTARSHYDTVLHLARIVLLSAEDREALNVKLAGIKTKLEALGERF